MTFSITTTTTSSFLVATPFMLLPALNLHNVVKKVPEIRNKNDQKAAAYARNCCWCWSYSELKCMFKLRETDLEAHLDVERIYVNNKRMWIL